MTGEDLNDHPTAPARSDESVDVGDDAHVSGATIAFWVLVVFLVSLGLCVLLSVVLALMHGS